MVAASRAGYSVTAIDAFADKQTLELADTALVVECDSLGFKPEALLAALNKLDANLHSGFVYGSGFEAQPELLAEVSAIIPVLGNAAATVQAIKTPAVFFASLQRCGIRFPPVFDAPSSDENSTVYLEKFSGGCGGTHIKQLRQNNVVADSRCYYQQYMAGRSVSLLFIAQDGGIEAVGFNEQWLAPSKVMPFRYGGAVSNIVLSRSVQQQLLDAAQKLTLAFGLVGLNSLDAIVQDELVYVLEVNPRLSATVGLYEDDNLLHRHVQACLSSTSSGLVSADAIVVAESVSPKPSQAHAIVYAPLDLCIKRGWDWPDWVVDTSSDAVQLLAGEPVCTVLASADNPDEAKRLAQIRVKMIEIEITTK